MKSFVDRTDGAKAHAYTELESFYHDRLKFEEELGAMQQHAAALPALPSDVEAGAGKYALYKKIIEHISRYRLSTNAGTTYMAAIDSYPDQQKPYLDYINYLKDER